MKQILVTGGTGFIGSHLCERLLKDGNNVICMDNYFTGRKQNVIHLLDNPYFELVRHDVTFPYYVEVDEIYNLACPASPIHYQFDPVSTTKTSVIGAINMLGLAKRTKARILQASTSEVYGDPVVHPQEESYWGNVNPIGIRSSTMKASVVRRLCLWIITDRIKSTSRSSASLIPMARVCVRTTVGVVSNFIMQALKGEDITIYGDGKQTRSFQYVDDLIEGMVRMMASENFTGPVNLGNPREFTMIELAEVVLKMTNSKSKIIFTPLPADDPKQRKPNISLAKEKLNGWEPNIRLEEGLVETIKYFKSL